jgi:hypothetical protein
MTAVCRFSSNRWSAPAKRRDCDDLAPAVARAATSTSPAAATSLADATQQHIAQLFPFAETISVYMLIKSTFCACPGFSARSSQMYAWLCVKILT